MLQGRLQAAPGNWAGNGDVHEQYMSISIDRKAPQFCVTHASEETLGPKHPDTLTSLNNLACTVDELGNAKESWPDLDVMFLHLQAHMPRRRASYTSCVWRPEKQSWGPPTPTLSPA